MDTTIVVVVCMAAVQIVLGYFFVKYYELANQQAKLLESNLDVDLDLATSDQLLFELRKRQIEYIMLRPDMSKPGEVSLTVEVHGIPPIPACGVIKTASDISLKQLESTNEGRAFLERINFKEGIDGLPPWIDPNF